MDVQEKIFALWKPFYLRRSQLTGSAVRVGARSPGSQGPALGTASRQRHWHASQVAAALAFQLRRVRRGWHRGRSAVGTSDNSCHLFPSSQAFLFARWTFVLSAGGVSSWQKSLWPCHTAVLPLLAVSWSPSSIGWFCSGELGAGCFRGFAYFCLLLNSSRTTCFRG